MTRHRDLRLQNTPDEEVSEDYHEDMAKMKKAMIAVAPAALGITVAAPAMAEPKTSELIGEKVSLLHSLTADSVRKMSHPCRVDKHNDQMGTPRI